MREQHPFLANEIKIKLIDYLVEKYHTPLLGNELLFSKNRRRADIVLLRNNKTIAFEIKGDSDDVRRLSGQIKDYLSTFDKVNIICTRRLLKKILLLVPHSVGIILFDNEFKTLRKAKTSAKNTKQNLVFFMKKQELLKIFKTGQNHDTTDEIRKKVTSKYSLSDIRKAAFLSLKVRLTPISKLFLQDKGMVTVKDDLLSLTGEIGPLR